MTDLKETVMSEVEIPGYIELANVTMSDQWHGASITRARLIEVLQISISALNELDKIKKAMFYGREYPAGAGPTIEALDIEVTPYGMTMQNGRRLIHSIIGSATESGEKLEALLKAIDNHAELDVTNLVEEVGDGMWYDAALLRSLGLSIEYAQEVNIKKLKARFDGKFTEFMANNRDLDAERKILEDGAQKA